MCQGKGRANKIRDLLPNIHTIYEHPTYSVRRVFHDPEPNRAEKGLTAESEGKLVYSITRRGGGRKMFLEKRDEEGKEKRKDGVCG